MKKFLPWILASGGIMLGLPCLAVTFLEDDSGMATCLILLFALNPIYAICAGVYAGKDIKKLWASPILTALFFLAGTWLFLDIGEKAFLLYALVYLFLGILAMLISMFLKKKHSGKFFWLLNRLKSIELSCSYFIRTVFHTFILQGLLLFKI